MTTENVTRLIAPEDCKPWAILQAQLALVGFAAQLIEGDDGRPIFIVSRWALTRSFTNLRALTQFAAQVGAIK